MSPLCTKRLFYSQNGDLKRTKWVFWSSKSRPSLLWWTMLCLKQTLLRPRYLSAVAIWPKSFELRIFSNESSKISKFVVLLFLNKLINSMFTFWKISRFSIFFLHRIVKWSRVWIIKVKFVKFWWKGSNFEPFVKILRFSPPRSDQPVM